MNKKELFDVLKNIADCDLVDGAKTEDHPCSVAVRAIEKCFSDIETLKNIANGQVSGKSKRCQTLLKLNYDPEW